jgi:hypothetical protein
MANTNGSPAAFSSSRSTGSNKASSGQMTIGSSSSQGAQPTWLQAIIDRAQSAIQNVGNAAANAGNAVGPGAGGIGDSRTITGGAQPIGQGAAVAPTGGGSPSGGGFSAADVGAANPVGAGNPNAALSGSSGGDFGGFASRYAPGFAGLLQNEPQALLAESLRSMGLSPNGGLFGAMAPLADQANPLFLLLQGDQVRSQGDMLNWLNGLFQSQVTPGASGIDYQGGLSRLLNAASLNNGGQNPLASFLNPNAAGSNAAGVDPQQQVRNFMALYQPLLKNSVPLIMQGALSDQANLIARDYINALAQGKMSGGNFVDYLHARQPFQNY